MKKILTFLIFSCAVFSLLSCNREQNRVKNMDGRWRVVSVLLHDNIRFDSAAGFENSYLYFESPGSGATSPVGKGYHQFDSGERLDFSFEVQDYRSPKTKDIIKITYKDQKEVIRLWNGTYRIEVLNDLLMTMVSDSCSQNGNKRFCYREVRLNRE